MLNWLIIPDDCDKLSLSNDGDDLTYEKQIAYVGQFYKDAGNIEFEITETAIDHWVDVQASLIGEGVEVPMPFEHNIDVPRKSTALEYTKKEDSKGRVGLFAKVKFKDKESYGELKDSQTSIYVEREMITPVKKTHHHLPITHVAWTEYPVLPGMDRITAIAASLKATPVFTKECFKKETKMADIITLSSLASSLGIDIKDEKEDKAIADSIALSFTSLKDSQSILEGKITDLEKLIPKKKDVPVIAASLVTMGTENRQNKIDGLLRDGYITAAQAKSATEKYCSNDSVVLALSSEISPDDFVWWAENEKLGEKTPLHGGEQTGTQNNEEYILKLSREDLNDPEKNPLHKAIAAKVKAAS